MAAGLGFKDFTTGEVLTAADVDGYLMQGVWVFASAAARDAAVTSPQEGNFAYLKDTNVTTYYTGSAWANLDTTGMTNPMTTTGDTIYSSSGSTPARLGIGSTGQVLTVAGGVPSWATPGGAGSNWSLLNSGGTTLSGSSTVTISGISGQDKLMLLIRNAGNPDQYSIALRINGDTGNNYFYYGLDMITAASYSANIIGDSSRVLGSGDDRIPYGQGVSAAGSSDGSGYLEITGCNSSGVKMFNMLGAFNSAGSNGQTAKVFGGWYDSSSTISSVSIFTGQNFNVGVMYLYGSA
jgi:hypothetical protein